MKQNFFYESVHDKQDEMAIGKNGSRVPAHFHRCIEIIYVTSGAVECVVNETNFLAEMDSIVFVPQCGVHSFLTMRDSGYIFIVIGRQYSDDFLSIFQKKTLPVSLNDSKFNETLRPYFQKLYDNADASNLVKKGFANIIIGSLLEHYALIDFAPKSKLNIIIDALNYIDEHYAEPLNLDMISAAFGYNKYYFSRIFNSCIGENFNNYINMVRIRNFMSIKKNDHTGKLTELVFACGFESMTTFYRSYAKFNERTPKEAIMRSK